MELETKMQIGKQTGEIKMSLLTPAATNPII
jgi:hypothetical protein